jgi:DNA-binding NarL/FixJ family response regulator
MHAVMTAKSAAPIRVFIIDDHRSILWGLERLIESGKPAMQVVGTATNCVDALKAINEAAPDLILLDIGLGDKRRRRDSQSPGPVAREDPVIDRDS